MKLSGMKRFDEVRAGCATERDYIRHQNRKEQMQAVNTEHVSRATGLAQAPSPGSTVSWVGFPSRSTAASACSRMSSPS
jgi:hypothetical protein